MPRKPPARPFFARLNPLEPQQPGSESPYPFTAADLKAMSTEQRIEALSTLSDEDMAAMEYDWYGFNAREKQKPPDLRLFTDPNYRPDWNYWFLMCGRGFGKTRVGAEWVRDQVENHGVRHVALVGRTKADVRDVMIEGESGLLAKSPPWFMPEYEPSKRRVTWPNGAVAICYSADEPDQLRGPQHEIAWCDEPGAWKFGFETWSNLVFGLRLGKHPRAVLTSTPRPTKLVKHVIKLPGTVVTTGSSYDNRDNLPQSFFDELIIQYEGTRLGQQEIDGILLGDNPGALWNIDMIDATRWRSNEKLPLAAQLAELRTTLKHIVVAIDPSASSGEHAAEAGIVVSGRGRNNHAYVLEDCTVRGTPRQWGQAAVDAYHRWEADMIVGEVNNGGEMVGFVIKTIDDTIPFESVHASRGKRTRAEPVVSLYERKIVHHVGVHALLEAQLCDWNPDEDPLSPDRLDALVWSITRLMLMGVKRKAHSASRTRDQVDQLSRSLVEKRRSRSAGVRPGPQNRRSSNRRAPLQSNPFSWPG